MAILTLVGLLSACGPAANPALTGAHSPPQVEILYQSRGEGEIEPCG
jgi:hypothetical protein